MPYQIQVIIDKVAELQSKAPLPVGTITDKVIQAYEREVLEKVSAILNDQSGEPRILALEAFLAENWKRVNGTQLAYTALPDTEVTKLLCNIAYYVQKNKPLSVSEDTKGAINYLMPTVNVYSYHPISYPDLLPSEANGHHDVDLDKILHTHILGDKGRYLIPVEYLSQVSEEAGSANFINVYYDVEEHDEANTYLNEDEKRRLRGHSNLTEQLFLAKAQYELVTSESNSLYGHLRQLCHQLYFNSVDGVGQELEAGKTAYVAIAHFFEYYDKLNPSDLAKVPRQVKHELACIKRHGSDQRTVGLVSSCLATRRQELEKSMKGREETLQAIAISGETKQDLLQQATKALNETKQELIERCNSSQYTEGKDTLGITVKLLHDFNVHIEFNRFSDLDNLKTLTPDAIHDLCRTEPYKRQIANAIGNLENMVILATELSPLQLSALVEGLDDALYNRIIKNVKDFKPLTIVFDQERRNIFWEKYQAKLKAKTKTAQDYRCVGEVLSESNKEKWYGAFSQEELMGLLKGPGDLFHLVVSMSAAQRLSFYEKFLNEYDQPDFRYQDKKIPFVDKKFYFNLHQKIKNKLSQLPSDPELAFITLWSWYSAPTFRHILFKAWLDAVSRPFSSLYEPLIVILFPVFPAFITWVAVNCLTYEILKAAWHLLTLQLTNVKEDLLFPAIGVALTVLTSLVTVLAVAYSVCRLVGGTASSVLNPIASRLPTCRFFKVQEENHSTRTIKNVFGEKNENHPLRTESEHSLLYT